MIGRRILNKQLIENGTIPVYSANVYEPFGSVDDTILDAPLVAAQWLARVAASDGAVTPSKRKVLSEFAKTYGLDPAKIIRLAYGLSNDCEQGGKNRSFQREKRVYHQRPNGFCSRWVANTK